MGVPLLWIKNCGDKESTRAKVRAHCARLSHQAVFRGKHRRCPGLIQVNGRGNADDSIDEGGNGAGHRQHDIVAWH